MTEMMLLAATDAIIPAKPSYNEAVTYSHHNQSLSSYDLCAARALIRLVFGFTTHSPT
jgi:hypothetical protein